LAKQADKLAGSWYMICSWLICSSWL